MERTQAPGPDGRRSLPSVDALMRHAEQRQMLCGVPRAVAVDLVRRALERAREELGHAAHEGTSTKGEADGPRRTVELLRQLVGAYRSRRLEAVINATGVILHTNLGRAPLPDLAVQQAGRVGTGYCNLELDLESGRRGRREQRLEEALTLLTGAEAAYVVNNNAAAVLLVLSATCAGRRVIISRGELIEIGGEFRLPEVMAQSGCILVEVGTTNRTRLRDYEAAITADTAAILKAHTSNYRILGFTESVPARELAALAHSRGLWFLEDLGSGCLVDTTRYGLAREPTVQEAVQAGADAVMLSGDKLLGGPQAGIIVGRRSVVDRVRRHPLARAVRVDKLAVAALQAVLDLYAEGRHEALPVWAMIAADLETLTQRARRILDAVGGPSLPGGWQAGVVESQATVGGGSLPGEVLPSRALRLVPPPGEGRGAEAHALACRLRRGDPPVVARVDEDALLIDLRTVLPAQDEALAGCLRWALDRAG